MKRKRPESPSDRAALRRAQMLEDIRKNGGQIGKGDLASLGRVYPDLQALVAEGKLVKLAHGSYALAGAEPIAELLSPILAQTKFTSRLGTNGRAKRGVGRYILNNLLPQEAVIGLDSGSGPWWFFRELVASSRPHAAKVLTNNLLAPLLAPAQSLIRLALVGGPVSLDYAAICGLLTESEVRQLDISVLGFSRFTSAGPWTLDELQWPFKAQLARARQRVVFAGTIDKIGIPFDGLPFCKLAGVPFTVVVDAYAAGFAAEERRRIRRERESLGSRFVMVDDQGCPVEDFLTP